MISLAKLLKAVKKPDSEEFKQLWVEVQGQMDEAVFKCLEQHPEFLIANTFTSGFELLQDDKFLEQGAIRLELTEEFVKRHSIGYYENAKQIEPGDVVIKKSKNSKGYQYSQLWILGKLGGNKYLVIYPCLVESDMETNKAKGWEETLTSASFKCGVKPFSELKGYDPSKKHQLYLNILNGEIMASTGFEVVIKKYLDGYAEKDVEFAKKYANPQKTIKNCCEYIYGEVRKQKAAGENCVAMTDDEVFGLAVHFYDEENVANEKTDAKVEVVTSSVPQTEAKKTRKPRAKKSNAKENVVEEVVEVIDENIPEPIEFPIFLKPWQHN